MTDWLEDHYRECEDNDWSMENVSFPPGLELPDVDVKCSKGDRCPICGGKAVYVGEYRGQVGVELMCPHALSPNPMDKAVGVPAWMYRLRLLTSTALWKRWSLEGIIDAKFYQIVEVEKDLDNLARAANAKFGNNSIVVVPSDPSAGGKMALYVRMPFWKAYRKKVKSGNI